MAWAGSGPSILWNNFVGGMCCIPFLVMLFIHYFPGTAGKAVAKKICIDNTVKVADHEASIADKFP